MIIAVNTRLLLKNKLEGIGWFTYETLFLLTKQHPEHTFYFLFDRPYNPDFIFNSNVKPIVLRPPARHPILFVIWFEISVAWFLKRLKPDLFLSPDGYLSLGVNTPQLSVIHDLNFEHYPQDFPWIYKKYYRYFFPKFAKKATRIATVSNFSKQDIIDQYSIESKKIDVVYNGINTLYQPISEEENLTTRNYYTSGCPYFVFVGALIPRKNLRNLFFAFEQFKQANQSNIKLVVVGEKKWWTPSIEEAYNAISDKKSIIYTGRLAPIELNKVLSASIALTYVSYFEGFGIPILEAYQCGTAVITSKTTSMPEVAGNGALLVDPFNINEIAMAMQQLSENSTLRLQLIENGNNHLKKFSWQKTADNLWNCIEKSLNV